MSDQAFKDNLILNEYSKQLLNTPQEPPMTEDEFKKLLLNDPHIFTDQHKKLFEDHEFKYGYQKPPMLDELAPKYKDMEAFRKHNILSADNYAEMQRKEEARRQLEEHINNQKRKLTEQQIMDSPIVGELDRRIKYLEKLVTELYEANHFWMNSYQTIMKEKQNENGTNNQLPG